MCNYLYYWQYPVVLVFGEGGGGLNTSFPHFSPLLHSRHLPTQRIYVSKTNCIMVKMKWEYGSARGKKTQEFTHLHQLNITLSLPWCQKEANSSQQSNVSLSCLRLMKNQIVLPFKQPNVTLSRSRLIKEANILPVVKCYISSSTILEGVNSSSSL